jgi:hypothetical protein
MGCTVKKSTNNDQENVFVSQMSDEHYELQYDETHVENETMNYCNTEPPCHMHLLV